MKHHTIVLLMVILGNYGFCLAIAEMPHAIMVTTVGENNIVNAIQKYSNITEYDVNRWKLSAVPFVGQYIRNGIKEKIRNFVKWYWFKKTTLTALHHTQKNKQNIAQHT